ncbi:biotin synthase BioB [Denitratisoma sp. DHT3]|uniref:biotin synthase BioB n=1 Tax=Denitratisoma sp. DHT3 TaxID=1981880 RepID=UPI0011987CD8|nr:biotin synthase BioB [Denitratisoma sp. DHT3]QDX81698.1 biotin synthase BioB [Denitratisoma sp. DHT3]
MSIAPVTLVKRAGAPAENPNQRWSTAQVEALFELPFADLMFRAQQVHREHHDPNVIQLSTLMSIKTGGCSEDCGYCSQSARHEQVERERLLDVDSVVAAASAAKERGASRFCMGAAWRGPKDTDLDVVVDMVKAVKRLDMETCVTLGMLKDGQAERLKEAGLNYYNHNIDTAPEHYGNVITTHSQADRFDTLEKARAAGLKLCCGGIVGMGESRRGRAAMIATLACMEPPPDSVPINNLVRIPGTPLENVPPIDPFEFARTIAAARITMPASMVRLSAGREEMSDELQALCFMAGANSIFYGDKLLTADNAEAARDEALFARLGLTALA